MGELFDFDSKFMIYAGKFADLIWLNILFLVCSVPVITIGTSYTAMHAVLLKIYRDKESSISKDFFHAFRENMRQSTILWIIYLVVGIFLIIDFKLLREDALKTAVILQYGLFAVATIYILSLSWVFILQSRYGNTIKNTIKNSFLIVFANLPCTFAMVILLCIPFVALLLWIPSMPLILALGFSLPGILETILYSKVFEKIEVSVGVEKEK